MTKKPMEHGWSGKRPKPTKCPKCDGDKFETALVDLVDSGLCASVVRCLKCGGVIGLQSTWEHPQITDFMEAYRKDFEAFPQVPDHAAQKMAETPRPTKCSTCEGSKFEAALIKLENSSTYASVVQCAECGGVIVMLSIWTSDQIARIMKGT